MLLHEYSDHDLLDLRTCGVYHGSNWYLLRHEWMMLMVGVGDGDSVCGILLGVKTNDRGKYYMILIGLFDQQVAFKNRHQMYANVYKDILSPTIHVDPNIKLSHRRQLMGSSPDVRG